MEHKVRHDQEQNRFVVTELGHEAYLDYYELPNGALDYAHTYTPNEIRGRGIATAIIRHALEYAREEGKRIVPGCPFVETYIDRHAEYKPLLVDEYRHERGAEDE